MRGQGEGDGARQQKLCFLELMDVVWVESVGGKAVGVIAVADGRRPGRI